MRGFFMERSQGRDVLVTGEVSLFYDRLEGDLFQGKSPLGFDGFSNEFVAVLDWVTPKIVGSFCSISFFAIVKRITLS